MIETSHNIFSPCDPSPPLIKGGQGGFTLIEIIVSIVAVGILMALMVSIFAPEVVRGTDPLFSIRATELGQSYLEEILGKRFAENSPLGNTIRCGETGWPVACSTIGSEEGANHVNFDDVDDYNNFTDGSAVTAPTDQSGNPRANYIGFIVTATVVNAGAEVGLNNGDAKRVTVSVTDPRGGQTIFSAYKTNF